LDYAEREYFPRSAHEQFVMSNIVPTGFTPTNARHMVELVYKAVKGTPVEDIIVLFEADIRDTTTLRGKPVAAALPPPPLSSAVAQPASNVGLPPVPQLLAEETKFSLCTICEKKYRANQPGQHFVTNHHCVMAREKAEYCSWKCRFRNPTKRLKQPPGPEVDRSMCDAPFVLKENLGVKVCRTCGGLREAFAVGIPKRGRGRPPKFARKEPAVSVPAAASAVADNSTSDRKRPLEEEEEKDDDGDGDGEGDDDNDGDESSLLATRERRDDSADGEFDDEPIEQGRHIE
jgi:hypothetical protein